MLPAVLASLAYRCSQVECSGWLSTIDARFNANLNGVYALQAGSSPFPGHTLENVVKQQRTDSGKLDSLQESVEVVEDSTKEIMLAQAISLMEIRFTVPMRHKN